MTGKQDKKKRKQTFRGIRSVLAAKFDVLNRDKEKNISLTMTTFVFILFLPLTADIVLKALRTLKVRIPDKFSTPGSIVI